MKFDNFKKQTKTFNSVYTDIRFDLEENTLLPTGRRDILTDLDYDAIRNELLNLFTTNLGENLLLPDYGNNLLHFVGESITQGTAHIIGNSITEAITKYAPRIILKNLIIFPDEDNNQYLIKLFIIIPKLENKEITVSASLTKTQFSIFSNNNQKKVVYNSTEIETTSTTKLNRKLDYDTLGFNALITVPPTLLSIVNLGSSTLYETDANGTLTPSVSSTSTFRIVRTGSTDFPTVANLSYTSNTYPLNIATINSQFNPALGTTATIPIGQTYVDINLTVNNSVYTGDYDMTINIIPDDTYILTTPHSSTINIVDDENLISLSSIGLSTLYETDANGTLTPSVSSSKTIRISRIGNTNRNLIVPIYYTSNTYPLNIGTLSAQFNPPALSTVTILSGNSYIDLSLTVNNSIYTGDYSMTVNIDPNGAYTLSAPYSTSVNIVDDDNIISISSIGLSTLDEGLSSTTTFRVSRVGNVNRDVIVPISLSSGNFPLPLSALSAQFNPQAVSSVTILSGYSFVDTTLTINNLSATGDYNLVVGLSSHPGYDISSLSSVTYKVLDNDALPIVSMSTTGYRFVGSLSAGSYTLSAAGGGFPFGNPPTGPAIVLSNILAPLFIPDLWWAISSVATNANNRAELSENFRSPTIGTVLHVSRNGSSANSLSAFISYNISGVDATSYSFAAMNAVSAILIPAGQLSASYVLYHTIEDEIVQDDYYLSIVLSARPTYTRSSTLSSVYILNRFDNDSEL